MTDSDHCLEIMFTYTWETDCYIAQETGIEG